VNHCLEGKQKMRIRKDNNKLKEIEDIDEEDYDNPRIRDAIEKKYYESKQYEYNLTNLRNLME
jgi:hypothetical protein